MIIHTEVKRFLGNSNNIFRRILTGSYPQHASMFFNQGGNTKSLYFQLIKLKLEGNKITCVMHLSTLLLQISWCWGATSLKPWPCCLSLFIFFRFNITSHQLDHSYLSHDGMFWRVYRESTCFCDQKLIKYTATTKNNLLLSKIFIYFSISLGPWTPVSSISLQIPSGGNINFCEKMTQKLSKCRQRYTSHFLKVFFYSWYTYIFHDCVYIWTQI